MKGILDTDLTACEGDDNRLEFLYVSVFHDWCYVCILVDTYMGLYGNTRLEGAIEVT